MIGLSSQHRFRYDNYPLTDRSLKSFWYNVQPWRTSGFLYFAHQLNLSVNYSRLLTAGILSLNKRSKTATAKYRQLCWSRSLVPPRATAVPVLALAFALLPQTLWSASFCDLNSDGRVDVVDVQLGLNQALGVSSCTNADLSQDGQCDIVDVQRLVNAALGQECLVGSGFLSALRRQTPSRGSVNLPR